jgi:hypothetical protein
MEEAELEISVRTMDYIERDLVNALIDGDSGPPRDLFGSFAKAFRRFHSRNLQR